MAKLAAEIIANALLGSKIMLHRFVDDLKPSEFNHRPTPEANCAAWIIGHLTCIDRRMLNRFPWATPPVVQREFEARFSTKGDAPKAKDYGDPVELLRLFDAHRDSLIEQVRQADEAVLSGPCPFPMPTFVSSMGDALSFLALHTTMHSGQITIIRRSLGYPPVV